MGGTDAPRISSPPLNWSGCCCLFAASRMKDNFHTDPYCGWHHSPNTKLPALCYPGCWRAFLRYKRIQGCKAEISPIQLDDQVLPNSRPESLHSMLIGGAVFPKHQTSVFFKLGCENSLPNWKLFLNIFSTPLTRCTRKEWPRRSRLPFRQRNLSV